MKMREIIFNAKTFDVDSDLQENIQKRLNSIYGDLLKVKEIQILTMENQVRIKIERSFPGFKSVEKGHINFTDLAIFCNIPIKLNEVAPNPRIPFSSIMNFELLLSDLVLEYNEAVRKRNKVKEIFVVTAPDYVTFIYKF